MTPSATVNLEKLLLLDPDAMLSRTRRHRPLLARCPAGGRSARCADTRFSRRRNCRSRGSSVRIRTSSYLAAQMFAHALYPDRVAFDFDAETRAFYKTFYQMELSDDDLARLRD